MKKGFIIAILLVAKALAAQTGPVDGYCNVGGKPAITSGLNSSNYLQGIIPGCTVTVYLTGTTTKATIYADPISTPLTNPFTAHVAGTTNGGQWIFWGTKNIGLDVVMSGGGGNPSCTTPPLCYPTPVTVKDKFPASAGIEVQTNSFDNSSQSLLNFVDTATVEFTNPSGGVESATVPDATDSTLGAAQCDGTTTHCGPDGVISSIATSAVEVNGSLVSNPNFNASSPSPDASFLVNSWKVSGSNVINETPYGTNGTPGALGCDGTTTTCSSGLVSASLGSSLVMSVTPPTGATYLTIYPSGFSTTRTGGPLGTIQGSKTSAYITKTACGLGSCGITPVGNEVDWTFTLPSYINPANVTAVYASTVASTTDLGGNGWVAQSAVSCLQGVTTFTLLNFLQGSNPLIQYNVFMSGVTGAQVSTITCKAVVSANDPIQTGQALNLPAILLQVADSIDTAPTANTIAVQPPLYYNPGNSSFGLSLPFDAAIDSGASTAYAVSLAGFIGNTPGQGIKFTPAHANTSTTPTLNLNGFGGATIVGPTGGALALNDIVTTAEAIVVLGPNGKWWLQNPQTLHLSATHNNYWSFNSALSTATELGPVYFEPNASHVTRLTARLSSTISCSVAPVIEIDDCGTATTCGSPSSLGTLTTGTADGTFDTGAVSFALAAGHFLGFEFSAGACSTTPIFDTTVTVSVP